GGSSGGRRRHKHTGGGNRLILIFRRVILCSSVTRCRVIICPGVRGRFCCGVGFGCLLRVGLVSVLRVGIFRIRQRLRRGHFLRAGDGCAGPHLRVVCFGGFFRLSHFFRRGDFLCRGHFFGDCEFAGGGKLVRLG